MPSEEGYTEKRLLLKVAQGDETAFRLLFDQYRQRIYSLSMYLTRSEFLAEEITQDVFLKIWINREQLAEINYFNAYLRTIARNVANNYLKRMATEKLILQKIAEQSDTTAQTTSNEAVFREYQQRLEEAIRQLPPQQKTAYLLSRQLGMKQEEIAHKMGLSIYTVKEYIGKAIRSIHVYINKYIDMAVLVVIVRFLP